MKITSFREVLTTLVDCQAPDTSILPLFHYPRSMPQLVQGQWGHLGTTVRHYGTIAEHQKYAVGDDDDAVDHLDLNMSCLPRFKLSLALQIVHFLPWVTPR